MAEVFRPVFVMGCPRSGTTLLATILDRHSRFAATPETHYFQLSYLPEPDCADREQLLKFFLSNYRAADCNLDVDELRERLADTSANHAGMLEAALRLFADRSGKPVAVEKTPDHVPFTPTILEWYPQARCVCIVRDGRDVVMSLKRAKWTHDNLYVHSLHWRYDAQLAHQYQRLYPQSFYVVRYEDLLRSPRDTVERLMNFLGDDFEPAQLEESTASTAIPEWEKGWKERSGRQLDSENVEVWRRGVDPQQLAMMNAVMGKHLSLFGYSDCEGGSLLSSASAYSVGAGVLMQLAFSPRFYWLRKMLRRRGPPSKLDGIR